MNEGSVSKRQPVPDPPKVSFKLGLLSLTCITCTAASECCEIPTFHLQATEHVDNQVYPLWRNNVQSEATGSLFARFDVA